MGAGGAGRALLFSLFSRSSHLHEEETQKVSTKEGTTHASDNVPIFVLHQTVVVVVCDERGFFIENGGKRGHREE